ncbi:transcription factor Tfb4 [Aureobasidium pullulans EXF-150]|uniref:General transcription and DNA repair factor IIH subunit TFB4 n=3 Tax=Aureobasidium pullulans TaxID=5580 RepID=A0A074XIX5_AURPU|nr:transcription factor Tfb4 [Aureobasidium pullulans EXF-150]KEQ85473.1 transcription factor Tfb4 [Aureobasidium pullulans EXF-150]THW49639.1 transcription factor Tfb4 [Aureobasidium pullulans]
MNAVDASSHEEVAETSEAPALLTIILDTNPHAWGLLSSTLPLSTLIANLLVYINAHLAINNSNQVAVVASHSDSARFLYPTTHDDLHVPQNEVNDIQNDANKYRPFAQLEKALTTNLRALLSTTTPEHLKASTSTMLSGALTLALTYIAKATLNAPGRAGDGGYDATNTAGTFTTSTADGTSQPSHTGLQSRILILSVSGDIADQYIPIMNSIFACQRLAIPIDILTLSAHSNAEFLQQAADATGGVYMALGNKVAGLLQVLMMAYLPDATARNNLVKAGEAEGVDFRAACFCHRNIVDLGYVCSICLSIFCQPPPDNNCLTCGTALSLAGHAAKPVVIPRKKKKKQQRKLDGVTPADSPTPSAAGTPR